MMGASTRIEEMELQQAVSLLKSTLDSTTDGILVVDPQGKITLSNQRFAEMWNIPPHVLDTRNDDAAIMHVLSQLAEPDAFIKKILELYAQPEAESFDVLPFKDGRVFERYSIPQRLDGKPIGRVWSFRDVTERRRGEQALRASEYRFREMAENLRQVLYLAMPDFSRILYVNPAFESIWARSCESLYESPKIWRDSLYPDDKDRVMEIIKANMGRGGSFSTEYRILRPDGEMRWIWDRAVELKDADGKIYQTVGIAEDITDRKTSEVERLKLLHREKIARSEAEAAVRARDEFLAIAAHELKTPIATLQIHLDGLLQAIGNNTFITLPAERQKRMIEIGARQITRLANLVQLLLDVTRAQEGRLRINRASGDLADIVRSAVSRCEKLVRNTGSAFSFSVDSPVMGSWDRERIEQVMDNLIQNAAKYGMGKPITVHVFSKDLSAVIEICDQGRGIPKTMHHRIFDKFERGDLPRGFAGLGMGLYIAREIVAAHGGVITVESEPGKGSLFRVTLPLE